MCAKVTKYVPSVSYVDLYLLLLTHRQDMYIFGHVHTYKTQCHSHCRYVVVVVVVVVVAVVVLLFDSGLFVQYRPDPSDVGFSIWDSNSIKNNKTAESVDRSESLMMTPPPSVDPVQ